MHFSFPSSWMWLQMIIQRDRHLVNDHMEGPASCKLYLEGQASSCVKSSSEHIYSLSGVKHTTKKNHEKLTIRWWCGGWVNAFSQPDRKISVFIPLIYEHVCLLYHQKTHQTLIFC